MILQCLGHVVIAVDAGGQHDIRLDDLAAIPVCRSNDRAFQNMLVRQKRGFDFRAGNIVAGGYDHVVGTRGEVEAPLFVLDESVAGQVPAVANIVALPVIREIATAGWPTNCEAPDIATRHLVHIVIDDPRFIAHHRAPGRSRRVVIKTVRNEDVEHFGGADTVQHRLARFALPFFEDRGRQRFSGGNSNA